MKKVKFTNSFSYKKGKSTKAGKATKQIRSVVKRELSKNLELKLYTPPQTSALGKVLLYYNMTPTSLSVFAPFQSVFSGTGNSNRIGDSILPKKIRFGYRVYTRAGTVSQHAVFPTQFRIFAFWSKERVNCLTSITNYATIVPWSSGSSTQLFLNGSNNNREQIMSYLNYNAIKVVYDSGPRNVFENNNSSGAGDAQGNHAYHGSFTLSNPKGFKHAYESSSSQYAKGKDLYIAMVCDRDFASDIDTIAYIEFTYMISYTDA